MGVAGVSRDSPSQVGNPPHLQGRFIRVESIVDKLLKNNQVLLVSVLFMRERSRLMKSLRIVQYSLCRYNCICAFW